MCMYVIIHTCIITFVLYINCTTYSVLQVTIYDMYVVVLLLYVKTFDGDNVTGQVDGDCKLCCYICVSTHTHTHIYYIYLSTYILPTIDS